MATPGGQDELTGKIFRIGHRGNISERDLLSVVAALEKVLSALGHSLKAGDGVRTAEKILR